MGLKEELSLLQITTGNVECFIINIIVMNAQMSAIHHTSCTTIVVSTFEGSVTLVQQNKSRCLKLYTEGAVHGTENKSIPHLKPQTVHLLVVLSYHIVLALDLGFLPNELLYELTCPIVSSAKQVLEQRVCIECKGYYGIGVIECRK